MVFNMNNVKSINIHLPYYFKIYSSLCPINKEENNDVSNVWYCSVVRSLMYVMVITRLYILSKEKKNNIYLNFFIIKMNLS
jgi:hypothetical protein